VNAVAQGLVVLAAADVEAMIARAVGEAVDRALATRKPGSADRSPRLTVDQAAAELHCHPRTVRRYIATGRLRIVRLATGGSSRVLIDRASLEALLAAGGRK